MFFLLGIKDCDTLGTKALTESGDLGMNRAETVSPLLDWQQESLRRLPLFGHRNWIVVADSAYPHQSAPGIITLVADADQLTVVSWVLKEVAAFDHVQSSVYIDREIEFISEDDASGISLYRAQLAQLLKNMGTTRLPHDDIIARLDCQARTFSIVIIKTTMKLPYTSIFIELQCGYWSAEAEARLRTAMHNAGSTS